MGGFAKNPSVFDFFCKKKLLGSKTLHPTLRDQAYPCEHVVLPTSETHHQLQHLLTATNLTSRD